tara:strand:- start:800 stop:1318 length:519 start_codon:yes stop_codon:yes gene_type:complete
MEEHGHTAQDGHKLVYSVAKRFGISKSNSKKLTEFFNESASIGFLPPLRDSMHYVKKLHQEHGYMFHAITSLSLNKHAQRLREQNLSKLFGDTVFESVLCLDTGADKDEALEPYRDSGCWWIEDKMINVDTGCKMGLRGILIEHGHSIDYEGDAKVAKNWKDIYNFITNPSS